MMKASICFIKRYWENLQSMILLKSQHYQEKDRNRFTQFCSTLMEMNRVPKVIALHQPKITFNKFTMKPSIICLSRPYHFKFFKGCLPQNLLGPFLDNLIHLLNALNQIFNQSCFEACPTMETLLLKIIAGEEGNDEVNRVHLNTAALETELLVFKHAF